MRTRAWAIAAVCVTALAGCGPSGGDASDHGSTGTTAAPAAREFTTKEFDSFAFDKTKTQIKAELGPPDSVEEGSDIWHYSIVSDRVVIRDADAGTRVSADLQFAGLEGADNDRVAVVRF